MGKVWYVVMVFWGLRFFRERGELGVFGDGNRWEWIVGGWGLLWIVEFLMVGGVERGGRIKVVGRVGKLLGVGVFVVVGMMMLKVDRLKVELRGVGVGVGVWEEVKKRMVMRVWVLIGVEGGVVVCGGGGNKGDVGKGRVVGVVWGVGV